MTSSETDIVPAQLNAAQQQVVAITEGPVLVVAGAGTGKTRVIVERILRLIKDGVAPEHILTLTFTEKAAGEMLERVNEARGSVTLDATIGTFNSFGNDVLQAYGSEWGLGTLRLLGETGQLVFLREHLDEFELDYFAPVSRPDGQLKLLADYVSLLKQQLVLPEVYQVYAKKLPAETAEERLEKQKHQELAIFFTTYITLCRTHNVIDYDDQLYLTIAMLKARPNILRELQSHYKYIMIDEFQDTNPMQSALVDMLSGKPQNIMVVGDDDQSIYGWRGATLANILDFKQRYPRAAEITLIENYRSSQAILDSAYRLIQGNNPNRLEVINKLDKRLHAQSKGGKIPQSLHFSTLEDELTWVANDITARLKNGQDPSTIAVLARRNQGVQKMHEMLELYDVPHAVAGLSNDIYKQSVVRQLIEAIKVVGDPSDNLALFHVLSGPLFGIDAGLLAEHAAAAQHEHAALNELLKATKEPALQTALNLIDAWRTNVGEQTVGSLAYHIITDSGWKQRLYEAAEHDAELFTQVQALSKFFKTLKEFEKIADVASAQSYLINLATLKAAGSGFEDASLDISDSLLNVLSVHRAKGLEWDTVYIIDCTEGSFPMNNFGGGLALPPDLKAHETAADSHLAEERRLMYVAVTRARHELILTHADQHGSGAKRKRSRFVSELVDETVEEQHTTAAQTSLELFAPRTAETTVQLPNTILQQGKLVLSVSQIDCYLRCPQDFYYLHVLRMPVPPVPALQYGTAIHTMIDKMHRGLRNGQVPELKTLLAEVQQSLPTGGYLSPRSRERAHTQAIKTVQALYPRLRDSMPPIESEKPFRVNLPSSELEIIGRIDAIYQLEKGIEIRDFKTGTTVTTAAQAKSRATSSNQLALYALAWQIMHDEMPELLTLDFVETGEIGSVKKQPKSLETLSTKLRQMVDQLQQGHYPAGKDHQYCKHPL